MSTVLIVDDSETAREYLASLLIWKHHLVIEAGDGAEALSRIGQQRPDLVISDLVMPSMDGYELVRQMRQTKAGADIPVIFYSAVYHEAEARKLGQRCGAVDVIFKPSEPEVILTAVETALRETLTPPGSQLTAEDFNRTYREVVSSKLARTVQELEHSQQRLAAVVKIGSELAQRLDPDLVMQHVCESARELTLGSYALLGVLNKEGTVVQTLLTAGLPSLVSSRLTRPEVQIEVLQKIIVERKSVRLCSPNGCAMTVGMPADHPPMYSILGVPVASSSQVYGWLSVRNKLGADEFTEADEQLAVSLGALAGVAYENARLVQDLRRERSELRQSEDQTSFALTAARMGVFEIDAKTLSLTWSHAMAAIFGLTPEKAPPDTASFLSMVYSEDRKIFKEGLARILADGADFAGEFRVIWPNGTIGWVGSHVRLQRDGSGRPNRLIGLGMDITAHKDLQAGVAAHRLGAFRATMTTVMDIVGNAFNNLLLFRLDNEDHLSEASLKLFDDIIADSTARLHALGNLTDTPEKQMAVGVGIDYEIGSGD